MSSASDYVYGELRRRLMAGSFLPGEPLREEHIATQLSVSRTPVRNAIERLIADGLVTREGRRGAVVLGWQDRDIDEAFELMAPDAPVVQFTSAMVTPIPKRPEVAAHAPELIWQNLPPARVWVYRKN